MNNNIYVKNIINILNKEFNEKYAANWDNVGLIIGNKNQIVTKIICCLDVTKDSIEKAIQLNANLIISHHPIIFYPIKKIIYDDKINNMNIITKAIKNNISIICMHTNADYVTNGINALLCKKLKLNNIIDIISDDLIIYKVGNLNSKVKFLQFLQFLKIKLEISNLRFIQCHDNVYNVAICSGSGGINLKHIYLYNKNIDTFITSDIKYDIMLLAYNININIIDAGHYETEKLILYYFKKIINEMFYNIEIIILETNYIKHL